MTTTTQASPIRADLEPDGATVKIHLTAFMGGGDRFQDYLAACREVGARWQPERKCNLLPIDQLPALMRALEARGLSLSCAPEIATMLRERADDALRLLADGRARLAAADARLASKGMALYPFQRHGVEWLAPRERALLADEMGLGKTAQALIALPDRAAALVVVPAAVLISWQREAATWRDDLRCTTIKGKANFRWPEAGEVVLMTYGSLPEVPEDGAATLAPLGGTVLIADEAHLLKGSKTARSKRWAALRDAVLTTGGRAWGLTGTPLINRPPELWAVLGAFGLTNAAFGSWMRFAALFAGRKGQYGYEWGAASEDVVPALQRVSLRRHRAAVLPDLPAKRHQVLEVNGLPASAIKACDAVVDALRERGLDLDKLDEGADLGKLISGPVFELMSRARAQLASAKIPAALELVEGYEDADVPLVVVSAHKEPVEVIGQRPGWAYITGDVTPEERGAICERFQAGELKGVAITYKAGGVGITLTRAAHVLMVDLDWTPALIAQAEDRVCRIGQKAQGILVQQLVATHPLDERVCELLRDKAALISASVEASAVQADHVGASVDADLAAAADAAALAASEAAQVPMETRPERKPFTVATLAISDEAYGKFRAPRNELELWAARGLLTLADQDPDRAANKNDVGFNGTDTDFGHSLAVNVRQYGRMSDKQWAAAVRMLLKYHRQIGRAPSL